MRIHTTHTRLFLSLLLLSFFALCAVNRTAIVSASANLFGKRAPHFATITVNSNSDVAVGGDGFCTLREAIENANNDSQLNGSIAGDCAAGGAEVDTIQFNIGTGTPTINLTGPTLVIFGGVVIDGGTGGATRVELNGTGTLAGTDGLRPNGSDITVRSMVINRFSGDGIAFQGGSNNIVENCIIGLNAAGTLALPNGIGIEFIDSQNNRIGGTTAAQRNVISGNLGAGILFSAASDVLIQGNFIGTNATGTAAIPNQVGINMAQAADNTVGGSAAGAGNLISGNTNGGVIVGVGPNNRILQNSIYSNGGLGINLGSDGVTANDAGDFDAGPNNLQNFPVINSITNAGLLSGSLDSVDAPFMASAYPVRIEFFANTACDASGNGEGETFLGFIDVAAPGNFTFSFTPIAGKTFITATATDNDGNTSEFSACQMITNATPTITGQTISRQQGSAATNSQIATVSDADQPSNTLSVTATPATGTGVTVNNIAISNVGVVTADVAASCTAISSTFTLTVTDNLGSTATAMLTVNVTANTPPTLSYNSPQTVATGGALIVNPATGPSDNGSTPPVVALLSAGTYTGTLTVNAATGAVSFSNAQPAGSHTITIRATDNCGFVTDASFILNVTNVAADLALTATGTPASARPDTSVTYTLRVTNNGPGSSPNTTLTDALPAAFTVENITTTQGTCTGNGTNAVNCNLGTLNNGALATVTIQAHVPETCQPAAAANNASVSGGLPDPVPANNSAQVTTNVQLPTLGPGACLSADSTISATKPGSLLFAGLFASSATAGGDGGGGGGNDNQNNTRVNLTNVHPTLGVVVHLFFVDGSTCSVADAFICVTANQTTSFLMSDLDPGTLGYMMMIAVDGPPGYAGGNNTGCPISFNYLVGNANIKFTGSRRRDVDLATESCASEFGSPVPTCDPTKPTATLIFDGSPTGFNQLPYVLAMDNIPSRLDGNDTMLMFARIDGNWAVGLEPIGPIFGILYNDTENAFSFTFNVGTCLFRSSLSNTFPRTTPRLDQIIPAGRSGWLKLWPMNEVAIVGAMHNRNDNNGSATNAFEGGHNLHILRLLPRALITVPVFPPNC